MLSFISIYAQTEIHPTKSSAFPEQENPDISKTEPNIDEDKSSGLIEQLVNAKWKDQLKDLDSAGIPVNQTLTRLLKGFKFEQVENAIALFKTRKRSQHIPNPA